MSNKEDKLSEVHQRALRRFDDAAIHQMDMRALCLQARRFAAIPGAQWEGDGWDDQFANSIKIEISKVGRGLRKIKTDYIENRLVPEFRPDGKDASQEDADLLDGLYRADSYEYKASQGLDNAFWEGISGGFGAWRLANIEEDEYDPDNDYQRINPGIVIPDADQCVFFDPQSVFYDKSDARYAFVLKAYAPDAYEDEFDDQPSDWSKPANIQFDWCKPDMAYVAEYYEKEDRAENCYILEQGLTGDKETVWQSQIPANDEMDADSWLETKKLAGWKITKKRKRRCRVHKYILSGQKVLQDVGYIAGPNIPIVPFYGAREFVDGVERFKGHTQDRMDAQRLYNSNVSRMAEINALSPSEKPIFAPEQMPPGPIQELWEQAHIGRKAYLLALPLLDPNTGSIVATGPLSYLKPPEVPQVTASLLQIANNDLLEDDEDGADTVKANTSAEAMDIAATRIDAKSGVYLDNMRQSVQRAAEIYVGMAAEVYYEEGREAKIMTEDGDDGQSILMEKTSENGEYRTRHDLTKGRFKVIASVSEATATRRDKTVKASLNIAEIALKAGDNEMAVAAILTAVSNTDGEGIEDLKAFARKKGLSIGLFEPNEEESAKMQEEQQQPDLTIELAAKQGMALEAQATKDMASAGKIAAETELTHAKTAEIVATIGAPQMQNAA